MPISTGVTITSGMVDGEHTSGGVPMPMDEGEDEHEDESEGENGGGSDDDDPRK
jgi:hypothetical protein